MKKILDILKKYYIYVGYIIFSLLFELLGVYFTTKKFEIRDMKLFVLLVASVLLFASLFKSMKVRYWICMGFLIFNGFINIALILIYDMTGTIFDFGMFNLRNDATGIIENLPINFWYFSCCALIIAFCLVFGLKYAKKTTPLKKRSWVNKLEASCLILILGLCAITVYSLNVSATEKDKITEELYADIDSGYNQLGITSTFINQLCSGLFFKNIGLEDTTGVDDFIYDENNIYYGSPSIQNVNRSQYNVISILGETWEWFSFIQDLDKYPNGFNFTNPDILREIYPNLYRLYDDSLVLTNFYAREKTDISENMSIIGSYPTNVYINYDYPTNDVMNSLPNSLKVLDDNILCNSWHNGASTYYNRNVSHLSLGFDNFYGSTEMVDNYGITDYLDQGDRNLDSEMIDKCKEDMFPIDQRFYTHITTLTMHGAYMERNNLKEKGYYDILDSYGFPKVIEKDMSDESINTFRYFAASAIDFDRAIGIMLDYLEETGLIDNTIIYVSGDHNAYYQGLTNYVKDIYNNKHENYTNLYRIPCFIRVPDMEHKLIDKFTTTSDLVPTVFDLLGINFYENLYYGHSIFSDKLSIVYSRAYDVFFTDNIYFSSLTRISYLRDGYGQEYVNDIEVRARELLSKLDICNKLFKNDYFAIKETDDIIDSTNHDKYINNLIEINKG